MRAHVVIGANYGDEGKGLMTDFLVRKHKASLVVRFNGGAQAGHTVVTPDGQRHVFGHIGSGFFAGADTFLSREFVTNPILFANEFVRLGEIMKTSTYVDPTCRVTTPIDMWLNQIRESMRVKRHGSVGVGFHETIYRDNLGFGLRVNDLLSDRWVEELSRIKRFYIPVRLQELDLGHLQGHFNRLYPQFLEEFMAAIEVFLDHTKIVPAVHLAGRDIVFEGAQGLLLDQDNRDNFPHVTHSKTGVTNVNAIASTLGVDSLEITYVTRTYATRHGAGPMPNEWSPSTIKFEDKTNVPHPWQGELRYGALDYQDLLRRIALDKASCHGFPHTHHVAMTHTDQYPAPSLTEIKYLSSGPTHLDVTELKD